MQRSKEIGMGIGYGIESSMHVHPEIMSRCICRSLPSYDTHMYALYTGCPIKFVRLENRGSSMPK